jgi:hypothetical protein
MFVFDTQHNDTQCNSECDYALSLMLTVVYVKCRKFGLYAECYNAECRKAECSGIVEKGIIKIK